MLDSKLSVTDPRRLVTLLVLPLVQILAPACADVRPPAAASVPGEGSVVILDHTADPRARPLIALAVAGPGGVEPAPTLACPRAPATVRPVADGRELAAASTRMADGEACAVSLAADDPPRDLVALVGLSAAPLARVEPELAEAAAVEIAALAEVAEREPVLAPENFVVRTTVRAYDFAVMRWAIVTLHYRPRPGCDLPACTLERRCASASHSAIAVYSWSKLARFRGRASLSRELVHLELITSHEPVPGLLEPIDMIAVEGADSPWLVTARRGCTRDDFLLFGPTGEGWGVLAGSTVVAD